MQILGQLTTIEGCQYLMRTKGIKIFDNDTKILTVTLPDVLEEIWFGNDLNWLITFLDGMPNEGQREMLMLYQEQVNKSENGTRIGWNELIILANGYFQIYETELLGCKDQKFLRRYNFDEEAEMTENCDIVITLIDCTFWEVYAKDQSLIDKLK